VDKSNYLSQHLLAFVCESQARAKHAQQLSIRTGLPITQCAAPDANYLLALTDTRLEIRSTKINLSPLYVDFSDPELIRRCAKRNAKETIARAVGIKGNYKPSVLDATAGLGKDAFVLANLGCNVHCLERSPIIAALLSDGLERLFKQAPSSQPSIKLIEADAIDFLKTHASASDYDVIYLDPMFPEKKKNALPRKGMRIFRELIGCDNDAQDLLQLALMHAKKRVVVKRPRLAEATCARKPDIVYTGKSSRFDVYINK
jgi:16S rRNA (guanine1516-N2)-methyltransferase